MDIKKALADIAAAADMADAVAKRKREAGIVDRASRRAEGLREAHRIVTAMVTQTAPVPVERTPETVLRAMLGAYQEASVEASVAFFRAELSEASTSICLSVERHIQTEVAISNIVRALGCLLVTGADPLSWFKKGAADGWRDWQVVSSDYEARLAGTTPIDAPPAEGT